MKKFTKVSMAVVAASSLLLAGCAGGKAGSGSEGSSASKGSGSTVKGADGKEIEIKPADYLQASYDDLKEGGKLNLAIGEVPEQLNPFHGDATYDATVIYEWANPRIALYDNEAKWYADPDFISHVEDKVVDGKTVVTWDINPKAIYNDGTPIDWHAFEATWKANNGSDENFVPADTDGYQDIESVKMGKDEKQAVVTYKIKYPWWKKNFEFLLNPNAAVDANTFNTAYLQNLRPEWGAGPYKVKTVDTNAGIVVYEKNPNWWGKPGKLDEIVLRSLDAQAEINAFKNNQLDAVAIGNLDRIKQVEGMDISRYTSVSRQLSLMQINSKSEVGKDKSVREAIFHAFDRPKLVEIRFNGMGYHEDPLGSLLLKPFQEGYEDNLGEVGKFDLDKSKKLLDDAGWKQNGEYRQKDGKDLEVHIPSFSNSATSQALYGAMRKMMKDAGIKMVVDQRKPTDFAKTMKDRDFDMVLSGFIQSNPFGMADLGQVYKSDSTLSKTSLGSEAIDKEIEKSTFAKDEAESIKFGNVAEKSAMAQVGWLPLFTGPQMVATRKGLANMGAMGYTVIPKNMIAWKK